MALGDNVMHAERLEHGAHRAASDNAGAGRRSAQNDPARAMTAVDVVMQRPAFAQRHTDQSALGGFSSLADRFGNFSRLAMTKADAALLVADNNESGEAEASTALDHFSDAIDVDQTIHELAIALFTIATATAF